MTGDAGTTAGDHSGTFDELAVGWALHALEPDDAAAFERHLSACDRCRRTVDETLSVMGALSSAAPDADPPDTLRGRLQAAVAEVEQHPGSRPDAVRPEPSRSAGEVAPARLPVQRGRRDAARRPWPAVLAAAAVAAVLSLGGWSLVLLDARDDARADAAAQAEVVRSLLTPGEATITPVLQPGGRRVATVLTRADEVQVVAHGLSVNGAGTTYVLWGIGDGSPTALGTFDVPDPGTTVETMSAPGGWQGYGISLERGDEAPAAPTDVVATGEVPA